MATSFYVYDTLKEYKLRYADKVESELFQTKIKDMYVTEDKKLWVVTNFTEKAAKPQLNRSIVHFYAGEVAYYKKGDEQLIVDGKILMYLTCYLNCWVLFSILVFVCSF